MSTPPGEPPAQHPPTQIVGQQTAPTTAVPHTPDIADSGRTSNMAMISLVTGILSYLAHVLPVIGGTTMALIAVFTGWLSRKHIAETPGEKGKDIATIGMILGLINLGITLLFVLLFVFLVFVLGIGFLGFAGRSH